MRGKDHKPIAGYGWVGRFMDSNVVMFGPLHRLAPPHDPLSGLLLALLCRDLKVLQSHIQHNLEDVMENPSYFIKHVLLKRGK